MIRFYHSTHKSSNQDTFRSQAILQEERCRTAKMFISHLSSLIFLSQDMLNGLLVFFPILLPFNWYQ